MDTHKRRRRYFVIAVLIVLMLVCCFCCCIMTFVSSGIRPYQVDGQSMEPALRNGQTIIAVSGQLQRNDIVVYNRRGFT